MKLSRLSKVKFKIVYYTFEEGRVKPALNVLMEKLNKGKDNIISEEIVALGNNQELVFNLCF